MKKFALIGAAGYIAPRHMRAIKETNHDLVAAMDPMDSVGIIDSFFPGADFFTEFERFDRHLDKIRRTGDHLDYVSICSPNYLHDAHIRFALRQQCDAICEKPVVLNPWNLDALTEIESETGRKVWTVLQLRHHPSIQELKKRIESRSDGDTSDVVLTYITGRGNWYYASWKGDAIRSGGIATNIGIHFFDMLTWIFGKAKSIHVHLNSHDQNSGIVEFEKATVRWYLSINEQSIPAEAREKGQRTYRSISVDGHELEFSSGFDDLHTVSYQAVLDKHGFGLADARPSIEIVHEIRHRPISSPGDEHHPMLKQVKITKHPFEK